MRKIEFSKHALFKINILKEHGFGVEKDFIEECLKFPDKQDEGYNDHKISQKVFDSEHVIRVVYEEKKDKILVITLYPGRRERYEKD